MAEESSESILVQENGMYVANGNMGVSGNLDVTGQTSTHGLKVFDEQRTLPIMTTSGNMISFKKAVEFKKPVQFNNGQTLIGVETTYNTAYVGSPTIQAGNRLVVGDSLFKITAQERSIIADTFKMTLARLDVDNLVSKRHIVDFTEAKNAKVTKELIVQDLFADTIKTNKLYLDSVVSRGLQASEELATRDLIVGGSAKVENDITIMGRGSANGAALTVNGGQIIANKGIVSHTGNNFFQTLEISGSGKEHDICFHVKRNFDSFFEGDVTIQDSKLVLDNSKLVTDNVVVTSLADVKADEPLSGVQITTSPSWETYQDEMVVEVDVPTAPHLDDGYDPVETVTQAMERVEENYNAANMDVKSLVNPITYLMEQNDKCIPKRFNVKSGVYRIDGNGNALFRNVVSEQGKFSKLEAYRFNVNQLHVDKIVTTGVASNVVHTDNVLKSEGIAEFDGSVNVNADVFVEEGSNVNVSSGATMKFENGASLKLADGAKFEMGSSTSMKMAGDVELDLNKVVFLDSTNGRRYKISFRDAHECEGGGIVMDYTRLPDKEEQTSEEIAEETELDARELDQKLKTLGI